MTRDQALVAKYRFFLERTWPTPNVVDCSRFIGQEVGELDSALMKAGYQSSDHARNNPLDIGKARAAIKHEIGQAYGMLCTLANLLDIDLSDMLDGFMIDTFMKHAENVDMDMVNHAMDAWRRYKKTGNPDAMVDTLSEWRNEHEDHDRVD